MIIDGTNGLTFNNSTTQASAGVVLQVVSSYYNTAVSTTSSSPQPTNLTATITPKFATSKILIIATMGDLATQTSGVGVSTFLYKNGSQLTKTTSNALYGNTVSGFLIGNGPATNYLDSPTTTSATTYAMYFSAQTAGTTVTVNRESTASSITLLEIAG